MLWDTLVSIIVVIAAAEERGCGNISAFGFRRLCGGRRGFRRFGWFSSINSLDVLWIVGGIAPISSASAIFLHFVPAASPRLVPIFRTNHFLPFRHRRTFNGIVGKDGKRIEIGRAHV